MTAIRRDGVEAPFHDWLRHHPDLDSNDYCLSIQNNDLFIHRFSARQEARRNAIHRILDHLAHLEIKAFGADEPFAQRDTFRMLDLMLRYASVRNGRRRLIKIPDERPGRCGCWRYCRWLGHHLLQMSADRPDNSSRMIWDGRYDIDESILVELLRFERDPDSPTRFLDTRRHHKRPARECHPDLFVASVRQMVR